MPRKSKKQLLAEQQAAKNEKKAATRRSIQAVIFFALALLLALYIYTPIKVPLKDWLVGGMMQGLFGVATFLFPIFLVWLGVDALDKTKKYSTPVKIWTGLLLATVVSAASYLIWKPQVYSFTEFFGRGLADFWKQGQALQGGLIGGIFAAPLIALMSRWGFGILLIAVTVIGVLFFFDLTLYQMAYPFRKLAAALKEQREKPQLVEDVEEEKLRRHFADMKADEEKEEEPVWVPPVDVTPPEEITDIMPVFVYDDVTAQGNIDPADIGSIGEKPKRTRTPAKRKPTPGTEAPMEGEQISFYNFPPLTLLKQGRQTAGAAQSELREKEEILIQTLKDFGIEATMTGIAVGPNVTRFELAPKAGTRVSKIAALSDDLALALAATQVRIEAPIPGKAAVGIEIPNKNTSTVYLREVLASDGFRDAKSTLTSALGKDIAGNLITFDVAKMPHLLVAGTTGSGKSVCINTILMSMLYKATPEDVKLILIDPKAVEMDVYNGIPHLLIPVVTHPKKAAGTLQWACTEMDRRYDLMKNTQVRNLEAFNEYAKTHSDYEPMPRIVVIIDELADLMMVSSKEVEDCICRLCAKARAAGIHLIVATQRPSADVVTGLIKANIPSRIAFTVDNGINSRIILDENGAEKLLGKGDMLYKPVGANKPIRVQGCFVADGEVEAVVSYVKNNSMGAEYDQSTISTIENLSMQGTKSTSASDESEDTGYDELLVQAGECVIEMGMASTSMLQRKLKLGYSRAGRIVDQLHDLGIIGPFEGSKPRQVLVSMDEFREICVQRDL
ncbi:MAG: DNA translocase FtsK 4TM domain-containing protein [Clostridia bacterium]|nr:DNA translocase FtsK 4TM domain-containing protein [Clostridia bacterium]